MADCFFACVCVFLNVFSLVSSFARRSAKSFRPEALPMYKPFSWKPFSLLTSIFLNPDVLRHFLEHTINGSILRLSKRFLTRLIGTSVTVPELFKDPRFCILQKRCLPACFAEYVVGLRFRVIRQDVYYGFPPRLVTFKVYDGICADATYVITKCIRERKGPTFIICDTLDLENESEEECGIRCDLKSLDGYPMHQWEDGRKGLRQVRNRIRHVLESNAAKPYSLHLYKQYGYWYRTKYNNPYPVPGPLPW